MIQINTLDRFDIDMNPKLPRGYFRVIGKVTVVQAGGWGLLANISGTLGITE